MTSSLDRAAAMLAGLARRDHPVGPLTTYRVGGRAALFVEAATAEDLGACREAVTATGVPVLVLGRGSNVLVSDAGFPGLVVTLGAAFSSIDVSGHRVRAGAATSLPVLARRTVAAGLGGLEWAVGVPGSVGGAVRMNAGGHGSETSQVLRRFSTIDLAGGAGGEQPASSLGYRYRHSSLLSHQVVVWAEVELGPGDRGASEAVLSEIVRWRRAHQPGGQNAGSVFTNPPGDSAGRLVELAGAKGMRIGSAQVSNKHANFIQADQDGSAADVVALMEAVGGLVAERTGVTLVPEVQVVGSGRESRPADSKVELEVEG